MTPSVRTLQGSKTKGFQGSTPLCPRGSNTRGFSTKHKFLESIISYVYLMSILYRPYIHLALLSDFLVF